MKGLWLRYSWSSPLPDGLAQPSEARGGITDLVALQPDTTETVITPCPPQPHATSPITGRITDLGFAARNYRNNDSSPPALPPPTREARRGITVLVVVHWQFWSQTCFCWERPPIASLLSAVGVITFAIVLITTRSSQTKHGTL